MGDPCTSWVEDPAAPLLGAPCGEETVCVIRAGCVHEHLTEQRGCAACAVEEQQAEGLIYCGRCAATGPRPHECAPLVLIVWDRGFDVPEPVTSVQQAAVVDGDLDPFGRSEVIKTARDEDLYIAWDHSAGEPEWIGSRAHALAAGCEPGRLRRADRTGSSYMPGALSAPMNWDRDGLIAEQRGHLARADLAAYVMACAQDKLTEAYSMLKPIGWGETGHAQ